MANSINDFFSEMINEAANAASSISDPKDKAMAYTAIASAIAQANILTNSAILTAVNSEKVETPPSEKDVPLPPDDVAVTKGSEDKKDSDKPPLPTPRKKKKEALKPQPSAEEEKQIDMSTWNDDTLEKFKDEWERLEKLKEDFGLEMSDLDMIAAGLKCDDNATFEKDITPNDFVAYVAMAEGLFAEEE